MQERAEFRFGFKLQTKKNQKSFSADFGKITM